MKEYLLQLSEGNSLTEQQMTEAIGKMLNEEAGDSEIAAFLMALKIKGETPEEIAGMAKALRENTIGLKSPAGGVMDNCGTGGDGASTFNISTTSAFVLAGAGIKVAKHGNRSVSSKTGSADVLEYLGVNLGISAADSKFLLDEIGITFLFAPFVHPKLKKIMGVRKELKIPTAFNLIGPLANPVDLDYQLVGVYKPEFVPLFAKTLQVLGRRRAVVVNGKGSLDEASLEGENQLAIVDIAGIRFTEVIPEEVGLKRFDNTEIKGGDSRENAEILLDVLRGGNGPYRETVLLNAGLGIFTACRADSIEEGIAIAKETIDSGAAFAKLEQLRKFSSKFRKEAM